MARTDRFAEFIHSIDLICFGTMMQQSAHFSQFSLTKERARGERAWRRLCLWSQYGILFTISKSKIFEIIRAFAAKMMLTIDNHSNENVEIHTNPCHSNENAQFFPFTRLMPHGTLFMLFVRNCFLRLRNAAQAHWHVTGIFIESIVYLCANCIVRMQTRIRLNRKLTYATENTFQYWITLSYGRRVGACAMCVCVFSFATVNIAAVRILVDSRSPA